MGFADSFKEVFFGSPSKAGKPEAEEVHLRAWADAIGKEGKADGDGKADGEGKLSAGEASTPSACSVVPGGASGAVTAEDQSAARDGEASSAVVEAAVEAAVETAKSGDGAAGETSGDAAGAGSPRRRERVVRRPVEPAVARGLYRPARSFVDHLPWAEVLEDDVILLEDGRSVGAVWEVIPRGTEGRSEAWMREQRDMVKDVLQDTLEEYDEDEWVVQTYTWRELDLSHAARGLREYVEPRARGSEFSEEYVRMMERHYEGVARPGGLFDDRLSGTPWSGARQRTLVAVYRWRSGRVAGEADAVAPEVEVLDAGSKLMDALGAVGVQTRRVSGGEFHGWLRRWFNGWTDLTPDNPSTFVREFAPADEIPYGDEFADSLFFSMPRSDLENGVWWFDRTAMRALSVEGLGKPPAPGLLTGERRHGDVRNAVLDQLPEGTVYVSTMVPVSQDVVEHHIDRISGSATGGGIEAVRTKEDCVEAQRIMGQRHKLYRFATSFIVRAGSLEELNRRTNVARAVLTRHQFRVVAPRDDIRALDSFLTWLPMAYQPNLDRAAKWRMTQLCWVQHIANLWPVFGRGTGTGRPGLSFFNRGGEPLTIDPLDKRDRQKNAHGVLIGPTGSGKSATLGAMLSQMMAVHRPRMFIIEAGNSFGLMAGWFESLGLTVNRVSLKPGSGVSLPTFADVHRIPEVKAGVLEDRVTAEGDLPLTLEEEVERMSEVDDDDDDVERDIIGELEHQAWLMVTGGEEQEIARLSRSDRRLIRDAIYDAGKNTCVQGVTCRTEHVVRAMEVIARTRVDLDETERRRVREMSGGMGLFCDGFLGEVFNGEGEMWPEADVTIVDLATFAREGYEAPLAITVSSLLSMINNIAERDQNGDREIVVAIDEAHIITTHPMVAPYIVKIVKMWRKLGAWLWLATQNLDDFPGAARKLLNMLEWWLCLVLPKEEVEQMGRFREMTPAQADLAMSARKSHREYTEGVLFSGLYEGLFRCVPASMQLSLAGTERHEKQERAELMREHGCTEVEAAAMVAREYDRARGIVAEESA